MAAPTVCPSKQGATLTKLRLKENSTAKKTHKNLLCIVPREWPRPPKDVERNILDILSEKLKAVPGIFKSVKPKFTNADQCAKIAARSQLAIGTSSVFRALEKNALSCVLVSGQATPAIAVDHIIALGQERGCPLLCLDQLSASVAVATESKCLPLAIGFKRVDDATESTFADVISIITESAPAQESSLPVSLAADAPKIKFKENKFRPARIPDEKEKEILDELKRLFTVMVTSSTGGDVKKKGKKQRKKKKNLKDLFDKVYHPQFEVGKRTVKNILERGKLQVILVSEEISPFLRSEPQSYSLLSVAAQKKCPVVVLPGLVETLRAICNANVSVLGFKKMSALPQDCQYIFQSLVQTCLDAHSELDKTSQSWHPVPDTESLSVGTQKAAVPETVSGSVKTENSKLRCGEDVTKTNMNEEEEEDYSYLYVLKKDSKELAEAKSKLKASITQTASSITFSSDFISFSSNSESVKSGSKSVMTSSSRKRKGGSSATGKKVISEVRSHQTLETEPQKDEHPKQPRAEFIAFSSTASADGTPVKSEPQTVHSSVVSTAATIKKSSTDSSVLSTSSSGYLDANKSESLAEEATPLFSVCRSGNAQVAEKKGAVDVKDRSTGLKSGQIRELSSETGVLGLGVLPPKDTSNDLLPLVESGKSAKKAIKRKMEADDSFISFAYTEANIKTMTSNPNKKKKKKKKGK